MTTGEGSPRRGAVGAGRGGDVKLYRMLTGVDDAAFCKRVSEALNKGWELHGSPALTYDAATGRTVCGQAVVKEVPGTWTDEMKGEAFKLGEQ
jgi:hypothetical protein